MIEVSRHLIAAGPAGRTRVLRMAADGTRIYPVRYHVWRVHPGCCRVCGCTNQYGCMGGCGWADTTKTLCTRCASGQWRLS
jgi:hypothetical protein